MTATDDEGDKSSQEVTVTVRAPGVEPPTVEASADVHQRPPRRLERAVHRDGDDPDGPEDDLLYSWDFGDGGSSFDQNPSHTYKLPGTYTAKVTVSDGSGATATKTITITVTDPPGNQAPVVERRRPQPGHGPAEVQFSAQATDADNDTLTYEWDFDDGSAKATGRVVKHTFTSAGTYDAR